MPSRANSEEIERIQSQLLAGQRPENCRVCWDQEDAGISSERTAHANEVPTGIEYLELNLSNLCQLKCRMCGSDSSTAWAEDEVRLRGQTSVGHFRQKQIEKLERAFASDEELLYFLSNQDLRGLKRISFLGGEPFLQKQISLVLQYLIDRKIINLTIQITTSATSVSRPILRLLNQFDCVDFRLSIEAVGSMYAYIRGGACSLERVEENIATMSTLERSTFTMSAAIGAYSVFQLAALYAWSRDRFPMFPQDFVSRYWYHIHEPSYVSVLTLNKEFRTHAFDFNVQELRSLGIYSEKVAIRFYDLLMLDFEHSDEKFRNFREFTAELDKLRLTSLLRVEPKFEKIFSY